MNKVTTEFPDDLLIAAMVDRWGIGALNLLDQPGRRVLRLWALQNEIDRIRGEKNNGGRI